MFDPFGDFETAGYLRNELALKDPERIKEQEHLFFTANLHDAAAYLAQCEHVTYDDFCEVHRILFSGFYPWAGLDRRALGVARYVSKGGAVTFEAAEESRRAVDYGLRLGNEPSQIAQRPGEVLGMFAWGHPFLDGNGRAMVVVHTELLARAGWTIHWAASPKNAYLDALTAELTSPRDHPLDAYLRPLMRKLPKGRDWIAHVLDIPGLDGSGDELGADTTYAPHDPEGEQRYQEFKQARGYSTPE